MVPSQLKIYWKQFQTSVQQTRSALKEVNAIMRAVDPLVVRLSLIISVFGGLRSLGSFAVIGIMLQTTMTSFLKEKKLSASLILIGILSYIGYQLLKLVVRHVSGRRRNLFDTRLHLVLEHSFIDKLVSLDLGRITDPEFIATKESAERRGMRSISQLFAEQRKLIAAISSIIIATGATLFLDPFLIILALVPIVPGTLRAMNSEKKERSKWDARHVTRRMQHAYEFSLSNKGMLTQLKLFRSVDYILQKYKSFAEQFKKDDLEMSDLERTTQAQMQILSIAIFAVGAFYLRAGLISGSLTITKLFFTIGCLSTFTSAWLSLIRTVLKIKSTSHDFAYWQTFFQTKPLVDETNAEEIVCLNIPKLSLSDVTFSYPTQKSLVLKHCSFTIEPGEKIVIVGRNGCGKTTIVRLLTKIFLPSEGDIRIDDKSIATVTQDSWLKHALYVTQESRLPDLRIDEVIGGCDPENVDLDRMRKAASMSGADSFVEKLTAQYETQIGEEWPGGVGFSSGQKQRLHLAAAFYRLLDPNIHIGLFDEPMANCDTETRVLFYEGLQKLTQKTIVVVAHDPLYLHHFDRVLVIEDGCVAEDIRGHKDIALYRDTIAFRLSADLS